MKPERLYADHNASSPLRPAAHAAMAAALNRCGNASSIHAEGRAARAALEEARTRVAAALGAAPANVVFTSGATEALHLAMEAACAKADRLIVFEGEHDAVDRFASNAYNRALKLDAAPSGLAELDHLEALLSREGGPALTALMAANNETGAVQPVHEAAALSRRHGGLLLVDAVQAVGRIGLDLPALSATYLVVSSHKLGGPLGVGCLILAPDAPFTPSRLGGGQERGRRPGTENVPAICGFAAALEEAVGEQQSEMVRLAGLRDRFEAELTRLFPDVVIFAQNAPRLPNTSLFALPGWRAATGLISLDLEGVAISSGAACSSGKVQPSRVLLGMGVSPDLAECAMRVSFGWSSQEDDPIRLIEAIGCVRFGRGRGREKGLKHA